MDNLGFEVADRLYQCTAVCLTPSAFGGCRDAHFCYLSLGHNGPHQWKCVEDRERLEQGLDNRLKRED